jgi:hypothetical protein
MKTFLFITFCLISQINVAQEFTAQPSNSKLGISGTSSLHDWECNVEDFQGNISVEIEEGQIAMIENFDFSFKVKELKSGKSGMDKKTYDALKENEYPTISYQGSDVKINGKIAIFKGKMMVAGVSKNFITKVNIRYQANQITLSGNKAFKLTDFNIEPPTAVFGTIKTGDEVALFYTIQLTAN